MTPAGLEPAIPGSVGRCLIHWATGPSEGPIQIYRNTTAAEMLLIKYTRKLYTHQTARAEASNNCTGLLWELNPGPLAP
jgi:hypothetical protein